MSRWIVKEGIYSETGLDELFDDDSITAGEYGFMRGYINAA